MSHKKQILEFSVSRYCIFFPSACLIFITVIYKDITKEKERRILTRNCCITLLKKSIFDAKEIKKFLASYQSVIWDRSEMALPWVIIFQKYVLSLVEGGQADVARFHFSIWGRREVGRETKRPAWTTCPCSPPGEES